MIQTLTKLRVMDNSGIRFVKCIKTLGGFNRTYAYTSDLIIITIKRLRLVRKVKVHEIYFALVTRTVKRSYFKDGSSSKYNQNVIILFSNKKKIFGTRLFGSVSRKIRKKKYLKILIMCARKIL
jgi:large subunit ribosomal protein L14